MEFTFDGRWPLMEDDLWWKTTFYGRWPLSKDDLWGKMTFDGRQPLTEDDLWGKTTFDGRRPLTEDDLWQKTTFDRRRPLTEDDLWRKTTFNKRRPSIRCIIYSILPEKNVYNSSPWQPQHNWPQTGNPISCLSRKKNFTWWKKCMWHHSCACVQKKRHF